MTQQEIGEAKYRRYSHRKFNQWRDKVKKHLPSIAIKFYSFTGYIPYEKHALLGYVIQNINKPGFGSINSHGMPLDDLGRCSAEVCLEIQVEELFQFVNTLK